MSDDYDDDGAWDDEITTSIVEKKVDIKIELLSPEEIIKLREKAVCCVKQKMKMLGLMFGGLNVYAYNGAILINDRYSTVSSIVDIAKGFGMDIHAVSCRLRGKNYVVCEPLIDFITMLGGVCPFGIEQANQTLTDEIKALISREQRRFITLDKETVSLLEEVLEKGNITIQDTHIISKTYVNGNLDASEELAVRSDRAAVESRINQFMKSSVERMREQNLYLQNGSAEIMCHRAKQMGYTVERTVKDKQIQLVLVRNG